MNIALIFASGTGQRMNTRSKPKQFLELYGKPIIIYTLEHFEYHGQIDKILVVCLQDWICEFEILLRRYACAKVFKIVSGDSSGADKSVYNGLNALDGIACPDDIVLIHDGVRPLINASLISENIAKAQTFSAAITVEPVIESVVRVNGGGIVLSVPPRNEMHTAKAPQSFKFGLIRGLYEQAKNDGFRAIDSSHLCSRYNIKMHTVISTPNNIKITAPQDYYIFRALYDAHENKQILGL